MKISESLEIEYGEDCIYITEHPQDKDDEDIFVVIEPEEYFPLLRVLFMAHLTKRAADVWQAVHFWDK